MLYLRNGVVDVLNEWLDRGEEYRDEVVSIYNSLTPAPRGYKLKREDPFSVACISAAFQKAGYTNIFPMECSFFHLMPRAINMGIWKDAVGCKPDVGDIVIYTKHDNKVIGVIKSVVGNTLNVIEGSTDVALKCDKVKTNSTRISAYICPKYNVPVNAPAVEPEVADVDRADKEIDEAENG